MKTRDEMIKEFQDLVRYSMLERERCFGTYNEDRQQHDEDLILALSLALDLAIKYLREDGE